MPAPAPRDLETLLGRQVAEVERLVAPDGSARCSRPARAIDDEDLVRAPLRRVLYDARKRRAYDLDNPVDRADLVAVKAASFYAVRTRLRLVTPGGQEPREPYDVGLLAGDDAFTDAFALHHLDELDDRTGLEDAAPGLSHVDPEDALAGELSPGIETAWALARYLGQLSDQRPEEVLRLLNQQDAVGKELLYADLLLRAAELRRPEDVAALERTGYSPRAELVMVINDGFAEGHTGDAVVGRLQRKLDRMRGPDRVSSADELWRNQRELVLDITRAHHSSWNGNLVPAMREFTPAQLEEYRRATVIGPVDREPANGEPERRRCAVHWSGTIRLDQERVIDAVDRLFDPDEMTTDELVAGRTGLRALVQAHEILHAPEDAEYGDARSRNRHGWLEAIDRGFGEAGARLDVDALVDRLPDEVAARLRTVETGYDDPLASAAAHTLADRIGPDAGSVLRAVNHETPDGKLSRAAELMLQRSPLAERDLPPIVEAHAVERIDDVLYRRLADIGGLTHQAERYGFSVADQLREGVRIGDRAFEAAEVEIAEITAELDRLGPEQLGSMLHAELRPRSPGRRRGPVLGEDAPAGPVQRTEPAREVVHRGRTDPTGRLRE
jgi:hypothetical protein